MLLVGVKQNEGWLTSRWNLTYRVGWESLCKAVCAAYGTFVRPEVLVDGRQVAVSGKEAILQLAEGRSLTVRGISSILKVPVMVTFLNQTNAVDVNVAQASKELAEADYEKFNRSLCQFMDSFEISMYL